MAARLPRLLRTSPRVVVLCAAGILMATSVVWSLHRKSKTWAPNEVPIAFWAWRNEAPSNGDVQSAIQATRARTIFLRAGQLDYQDGTLSRIRIPGGTLPRGIEVHFVYNATRSLLTQLEKIDEESLAASLAETFTEDLEHGRAEHATVAGIQVDIDVPTRLLPRYATTLRALRKGLPRGLQLSITGLPTWMDSSSLGSVLDQVDFWIPQCYGSEIPERLDQAIPISSPQFVSRAISRARQLNHPFYAGLAAYSYALLYSGSGALITLRGDLDPSQVANDANLELIERRTFNNTSEWRYVYRARSGGVTQGLAMNAGDVLVIAAPSTESLRSAARAVRELAGAKLLGICVFRLPGGDDAATLIMDQIAAALDDRQPRADVSVALVASSANETLPTDLSKKTRLTVVNTGTEGILAGDGLTLDLAVPPGSAQQITLEGFSSVTSHCGSLLSGSLTKAVPCSERRANIIRLKLATLAPGQSAQATLAFSDPLPSSFFTQIEIQSDDGQTYRFNRQLSISNGARK